MTKKTKTPTTTQARHCYAVLGVSCVTPAADVRAAFLRLAKELHPDRNGGTPEANDRFAEVTQAYATLSDPKLRNRYEIQLALLTERCAACGGEGAVHKQKGFGARATSVCPVCEGSGRSAQKGAVR